MPLQRSPIVTRNKSAQNSASTPTSDVTTPATSQVNTLADNPLISLNETPPAVTSQSMSSTNSTSTETADPLTPTTVANEPPTSNADHAAQQTVGDNLAITAAANKPPTSNADHAAQQTVGNNLALAMNNVLLNKVKQLEEQLARLQAERSSQQVNRTAVSTNELNQAISLPPMTTITAVTTYSPTITVACTTPCSSVRTPTSWTFEGVTPPINMTSLMHTA